MSQVSKVLRKDDSPKGGYRQARTAILQATKELEKVEKA